MTDRSDRFRVKFWGVRGSTPVPGPTTVRYGGNTTCVEVRCGDTLLIIDAGSGIRELGKALIDSEHPVDCHLLMSHVHWDHIQGFPFFSPAFLPTTSLTIWSQAECGRPVRDVLNRQMSEPMFPIGMDKMVCSMQFHEFHLGEELKIGDVTVRTAPLNHPGGATAYRIDYGGKSYVHASDHEHTEELYQPLLDLSDGADCLVYDAAYTHDEYLGVGRPWGLSGWGHSTWQEGVKIARAARVPSLVLFQHQYDRTDTELDVLARVAKQEYAGALMSREGMELDLFSGMVSHPDLPAGGRFLP